MQGKITTVGFLALGCPKSIVDSERMLADIGGAGFVISGDIDNADVVVINTCGFIAPACEEALEAIRGAVRRKEEGAVGRVIVTGCLPERLREAILTEVPGVDAVVGLAERDRLVEIIGRTLRSAKPAVYLGEQGKFVHDDRGRMLLGPRHWAYLRISEGCDRRCSFCTIPAIRGRFRSKPPDKVLAEAEELVANGAVELSIIAQDSNYYGRDIGQRDGLRRLLAELERIEHLQWIRLMYLYPAGIDDGLIDAIATSQKVVRYVDMPVQHISDRILRAMRREDRKQKTIRLIEKLREAMPDVVLRTTVMVGFPGETEAEFAELVEFVKWARFDALGCFTFYPESGTAAAELSNQVQREVKQQRLDEIMSVQQRIAFEKNRAMQGREMACLVDSVEEEAATGRYYGQAPHIDSVCLIEDCSAGPGDFVRVRVTGSSGYDLVVRQI